MFIKAIETKKAIKVVIDARFSACLFVSFANSRQNRPPNPEEK